MNNTKNFLNGIQINPLSFVDEGVENCIDNLKNRFHINFLLSLTIADYHAEISHWLVPLNQGYTHQIRLKE